VFAYTEMGWLPVALGLVTFPVIEVVARRAGRESVRRSPFGNAAREAIIHARLLEALSGWDYREDEVRTYVQLHSAGGERKVRLARILQDRRDWARARIDRARRAGVTPPDEVQLNQELDKEIDRRRKRRSDRDRPTDSRQQLAMLEGHARHMARLNRLMSRRRTPVPRALRRPCNGPRAKHTSARRGTAGARTGVSPPSDGDDDPEPGDQGPLADVLIFPRRRRRPVYSFAVLSPEERGQEGEL